MSVYTHPKTVAEARALLEILSVPEFRPLAGEGLKGDDILFFENADGRLMTVIQTVEGTRKIAWNRI